MKRPSKTTASETRTLYLRLDVHHRTVLMIGVFCSVVGVLAGFLIGVAVK